MREASSLVIIRELVQAGAKIKAYDPEAMEEAKRVLGDMIEYVEHRDKALDNADALLVVTEWNEFRNPDFELIKEKVSDKIIFDGRNLYSPERIIKMGFDYICIGRNLYSKK